MPDWMPHRMPDKMPDRASERMPDRMMADRRSEYRSGVRIHVRMSDYIHHWKKVVSIFSNRWNSLEESFVLSGLAAGPQCRLRPSTIAKLAWCDTETSWLKSSL